LLLGIVSSFLRLLPPVSASPRNRGKSISLQSWRCRIRFLFILLAEYYLRSRPGTGPDSRMAKHSR
jgi:hypothetical protein